MKWRFPLQLGAVAIEKGAFGSPSTKVTNFIFIMITVVRKRQRNLSSKPGRAIYILQTTNTFEKVMNSIIKRVGIYIYIYVCVCVCVCTRVVQKVISLIKILYMLPICHYCMGFTWQKLRQKSELVFLD